jgi:hypothetical protein
MTSTSLRTVLLAVVAVVVAGTLAAGPATAADPGATLSGTIATTDGGTPETPLVVTLYAVAPDGALYPTPQDSQLIFPGDDLTFDVHSPLPGYYSVRVRPAGGAPTRYLTTWLGDLEELSTDPDGPGVVFIGEDLVPSTGHVITLRRGSRVSGTVRGAGGGPVADATVTANRWVADGDGERLEPVPSVPGAITSADGSYTMVVPDGTALALSVSDRGGYRDYSAKDHVTVEDDRTEDIELTPDWSDVGRSGRVVRDEFCLEHGISGTADLAGLRLDVGSFGVIAPEGAEPVGDPLAPGSTVPALVPYWSDTARQLTWGVSGSTLCAV